VFPLSLPTLEFLLPFLDKYSTKQIILLYILGKYLKFGFIWPSGFKGEDFKKSANQKRELPMASMFVNGSGQNEQS
jgi:hypothetical protein